MAIPAEINGYEVKTIGDSAFSGRSGLTSVTIPNSVTSIGRSAFLYCYGLTSVTIPNSVTSIGDQAFDGCSGLTSVTIPSGVKSIGHQAFFGCGGLTSVTIPSGVTSIGRSAFYGCSGLTSVTIPSSVTNIVENSVFSGCDNIRNATVPGCLCGINPLSLKTLVISDGTTNIVERAFYGCSGLTSVTIPNGVTSIGEYAFSYCSGLTSVTIPSSVTSIGIGVFQDCSSMQDIFVSSANTHYAGVDGVLFNKSKTQLVCYPCGRSGAYEVPSSTTSIAESAFWGCSGLTSVTIPSSVTSIGSRAFSGCRGLKEVSFEADAPATGDNVFGSTPADMVVRVKDGSIGWLQWCGRKLVYEGGGANEVHLTVTNVVVHYILNSVQPEIAVPVSGDTGFVAIITEVKSSGAVSVPIEWKKNYPLYEAKFGTDFGKSLMMKTGKRDGAGNEMLVWQDYVAGTDPTDEDDQFTASITMVGDVPVISYSPELTAEQAALRSYKTFGKKQLKDEWVDLTDATGETLKNYNFFKVTVEMK